MDLPIDRLQRGGASPEEIDELQAEFDASTPAVQRSLIDTLAPLSDAGVYEYLEQRRSRLGDAEKGEGEPEDHAPEPSGAAAESTPADAQAKPATSGKGKAPASG